jgi:hypothetical protein
MYEIAKLKEIERELIFRNTANKMNVNEAIIEKDFWIVLMLDYLFNKSIFRKAFAFKGGTSLSKGYSLIRRFSEDVDLIVDWTVFGIPENEPYEERSNTQQSMYNLEINKKAGAFIKNTLLSDIKIGLRDLLGYDVDLEYDKSEENIIIFKYPRLYSNDAILNTIRLEFGPLAAWSPSEVIKVSPYINDYYPNVMNQPFTEVLIVKPSRTFWEKATILHHEAHRPNTSKMPHRYSRHYYDLYMMSLGLSMDEVLEDIALLDDVVAFKEKFYPRGWASYDLAKRGTLKLIPEQYRIDELKKDYNAMQDMLFGDKPSFDDIMDSLGKLEMKINGSTSH